jgi:hypothetical protein
MTGQAVQAARFLAMHRGPGPLLLPNFCDQGSARLLASLGFQALATTSSGYAATLGGLEACGRPVEADGRPPAALAWPPECPGEARSSSLSRRCRAGW